MNWTDFSHLVVALAILGLVGALAALGTISSGEALTVIGAIAGSFGVSLGVTRITGAAGKGP